MFKKNLNKLVCVLSAALLAVSAAACGGGDGSESSDDAGGKRENETKIVIYTGGSSEFSWTAGSEEDDVIDYIEEKYHADTGVWLDFRISHLADGMRRSLTPIWPQARRWISPYQTLAAARG